MEFDAIIVGSGFGGTVAATQLLGAWRDNPDKKVLILERGAWWISPISLSRPPKSPPAPSIGMRKWLEPVRRPDLHSNVRDSDNLINFCPPPAHARDLIVL